MDGSSTHRGEPPPGVLRHHQGVLSRVAPREMGTDRRPPHGCHARERLLRHGDTPLPVHRCLPVRPVLEREPHQGVRPADAGRRPPLATDRTGTPVFRSGPQKQEPDQAVPEGGLDPRRGRQEQPGGAVRPHAETQQVHGRGVSLGGPAGRGGGSRQQKEPRQRQRRVCRRLAAGPVHGIRRKGTKPGIVAPEGRTGIGAGGMAAPGLLAVVFDRGSIPARRRRRKQQRQRQRQQRKQPGGERRRCCSRPRKGTNTGGLTGQPLAASRHGAARSVEDRGLRGGIPGRKKRNDP
mmetsp:Transcript_3524/g.8028  ORF Transcript_3524/g.8028 Transcript_3524/m.8028 type:complete len:293 (+) Transcript_3524:173-1051(+)